MSRSSADLVLGITPGAIALVRGSAREVVRSEHADPLRLLPQVEALIKSGAWHARRVRVVLSHRLVRHALTQAPGKALSEAEETALVRARLVEIYGEEAAAWRVRVISQPPDYGLLGAGLDEGLCAALEALARRNNWSLSLAPLAAALPTPRSASGVDAWFVAEPGWATLFYGKAGRVRQLTSMALSDDWRGDLADWLARTADRAGDKPVKSSVLVQSVGLASATAPALDGWRWSLAQAAAGEADAVAIAMGAA